MTPYRDSAGPDLPESPYSKLQYSKPQHPKSDYHRQSHSSHYRQQHAVPRPVLAPDREPAQGLLKPPVPRPVSARQRSAAAAPVRPLAQPASPRAVAQRVGKPGGYVLAGGSMMLALMAFLLPQNIRSQAPAKADVCQQEVQAQSVLSRTELTELLSVPERSAKEAVRQVIAEPFCLMSPVEVREGAAAEREAYPLEFDPQTWLVILYEGNEYAGYDFSFRQ